MEEQDFLLEIRNIVIFEDEDYSGNGEPIEVSTGILDPSSGLPIVRVVNSRAQIGFLSRDPRLYT